MKKDDIIREYWLNDEKIIRMAMLYNMKSETLIKNPTVCLIKDQDQLNILLLEKVRLLKLLDDNKLAEEGPLKLLKK